MDTLPIDIIGHFLTFLSIRDVEQYVTPLSRKWQMLTNHPKVCNMRVYFHIENDFPKKPVSYQYIVRCITSNRWEYLWVDGTDKPNKCPVDPSHKIDKYKISKISSSDIDIPIDPRTGTPLRNMADYLPVTNFEAKLDEIIIRSCEKYPRLQNIVLGLRPEESYLRPEESYDTTINQHSKKCISNI